MEESTNSTENETTVGSNDAGTRKMARQIRIKARLEAARRLKSALDGSAKDVNAEKSHLISTIENSNEKLFQVFVEGKELVTNIRVASDSREIERRDEELAARNARLEKLEAEACLAMEKLQEITGKWDKIQVSNDPLDLYQELKDQKSRCLELIQQKDNLIGDFKEELKLADERFMSDREDMFQDISMLAKRIDEQVSVMKDSYFSELENIEEAIDKAREEVLKERQTEWEKLYEQRETDEVANMNSKFSMAQANNEEIRQEHVKHEEKFRETKIRIETDVQALEQELEQVKVRCLINSEKLDYNYQILKKREDENIIIKSHQKRTLIKCQEDVMNLKKKVEQAECASKSEMKRLDKELCHYHTNVIHIENKADHFSQVNNVKFLKIWEMKTEEAQCLLDKILAADKIIHEQILGLEWQAPEEKPLKKEDLPSYQAAVAIVDEIFHGDDDAVAVKNSFEKVHTGELEQVLKHILSLIADESGFLVEERLEQLLEPYTEAERKIVRLETVFTAIGVQKKEDIQLMKDYFLHYAACNVCTEESAAHSLQKTRIAAEQPSEEIGVLPEAASGMLCANGHPLCIERVYVLKALREFVTKLHASKFRERADVEVRLAKHRCTISRLVSPEDLQAYWEQFTKIFPDDCENIWDVLYDALAKYHTVLQERQKVNDKVQKLRQQNQELGLLVSKYVPQSNARKLTLLHNNDTDSVSGEMKMEGINKPYV